MSGPTRQDAVRAVVGAAIFAAIFLLIWYLRPDPAKAIASRTARVELVGRMQAGLSAASEAEKSAVLAVADAESRVYADQARAATAEVELERRELEQLLGTVAARGEAELLARFSEAFARLQRIDDQVLGLAARNTNVKAYGLAFGPAAEALEEVDGALARLANRGDGQVARLADDARIALLRIQSLLAPHIAEESDAKMARLEVLMRKAEAGIRGDFAALASRPAISVDPDFRTASSRLARYLELEAQILVLSRENTNVQSLALSLNQKRKAMVECLSALGSLKQAILEEPIPGVPYGRVPTR
jgi:hypothetical protein